MLKAGNVDAQVLPGLTHDDFAFSGTDLAARMVHGDVQGQPGALTEVIGAAAEPTMFEQRMAAVFADGHMPLVEFATDLAHAPWSHDGHIDLLGI